MLVLLVVSALFVPNNATALETSHYWVNPIYKSLYEDRQPLIPTARRDASAIECNSYEDVKAALKEKFENRETSFSLHLFYSFAFSDVKNILSQAKDEVLGSDDYLKYSMTRTAYGASGTDGDVDVAYQADYHTTYTQEQQVNQRVTEVLAQIITGSMNDEEKEKAIHDWIVKNVQYDTSLEKYSAYAAIIEGTAVCQGYALLTYKMLKESGVTNKIIEGQANGGNHAWNLVYLCGNWYHLDCTFDDPVPDVPDRVLYNYFNRSDTEISSDHTWESANYPAAPTSYVEGVCSQSQTECRIAIKSLTVGGTVQLNSPVTFTLEALNSCGSDIYYRFDLIPNYGTAQYDPNTGFSTIQEFTKGKNSCEYTFTEQGSYIIIGRASKDTTLGTGAVPLIGASVTVSSGSNSSDISGLTFNLTGSPYTGDSITFTASAVSSTGKTLYYRFDLIPDYGTDNYDPANGFVNLRNFDTRNTFTYQFNQAGGYVLVVKVSETQGFAPEPAPLIGGTLIITDAVQ